MLALEGEPLLRERKLDHRERLLIDALRFFHILAVEHELDRRAPAADADLEPALAQMIEHRNLFGETQRVIERQEIDQRTEAQPPRALRDRREKHAGRRRHAERRRMMLGEVIGVEAEPVIELRDAQPLVIKFGYRPAATIEMIENPEFQLTH